MVTCEYCYATRVSNVIEMDIGTFCSTECMANFQEELQNQGVENYDYNIEREP